MTAQQYQQGILRFTPPGEFSQGFDFTPLWLQIDNPSSYYISFPQAPSLGTIPPYYTGVIVAWNQSNLTVNVLASPGASGSPSLPSSNAELSSKLEAIHLLVGKCLAILEAIANGQKLEDLVSKPPL